MPGPEVLFWRSMLYSFFSLSPFVLWSNDEPLSWISRIGASKVDKSSEKKSGVHLRWTWNKNITSAEEYLYIIEGFFWWRTPLLKNRHSLCADDFLFRVLRCFSFLKLHFFLFSLHCKFNITWFYKSPKHTFFQCDIQQKHCSGTHLAIK